MAVVFQRKAVNKRKKKGKELERDSHEFPSFSEMISDAGMALFPGKGYPFPYNALYNESGFS